MLSSRLFDLPIAVFDVETTGASVDYGDRIVELGIVRLERGEVVGTFERLVNPQRRMSGGASAVTGITNEMLMDQPLFCDVWSHAKTLFEDAIVVGHNVGFDIAFLIGECRRLGCKLCDVLGDLHVLDTVRIARKQLGRGGNGLQRLASRLDIASGGAHRALVDCHTTAKVLHKLLEPHGAWDVTLERAHTLQGRSLTLATTIQKKSDVPDAVTDAMMDGSAVQITYIDASAIRTTRSVTPRNVRRVNGQLTLIAQCHQSNALRSFKVNRIIHACAIDEGSQLTLDFTDA